MGERRIEYSVIQDHHKSLYQRSHKSIECPRSIRGNLDHDSIRQSIIVLVRGDLGHRNALPLLQHKEKVDPPRDVIVHCGDGIVQNSQVIPDRDTYLIGIAL
jgi:hypothetical protein